MHIVTTKRAPLFRPCGINYDTLLGLDVSALYDEVLLICPDELVNDDPVELDLDGTAQQEVVHIVPGDDGTAHVEPYWAYPDKSARKSWEMFRPGPAVVNIGTLKTPPESMFSHNDIFLPLWDVLLRKAPEQMTEFERFWCSLLDDYPSPNAKKAYQRWRQLMCVPKNELTDDERVMLDIMNQPIEKLSADERVKYAFFLFSLDLPF